MPRVFKAKKTKRGAYQCGACRRDIQPGESYFYFTPYKSTKRIRCAAHYPKASELTGSETLSRVYSAQEQLSELCDQLRTGQDVEAFKSEVEGIIDDLGSLQEETEDKISNLEQAFPNGCPSLETLQGYQEGLESYISELQSQFDDIDNIADEAPDTADELTEEQQEKLTEICNEIADNFDGVSCDL